MSTARVYHWVHAMTRLSIDWTENDAPLTVVRTLREAGHEAWLAGGCVRDLLLGATPKDFDIASSATPHEVRQLFPVTIPVQPELGVTMVIHGTQKLEVTAFRMEGPYLDGRRPSHVVPTTAQGDVQRRDFSINGLLLDPQTGEVVDHVGGIDDLNAKVLRAIGVAHDRFSEDHLRILRAVRFAVRLGFSIEDSTWQAMCGLSGKVSLLSGERILEELAKMFTQGPFARSLELLLDCGVLEAVSPELATALENPASRQRLVRWLQVPTVSSELWPGLLAAPLCPWWEELNPRIGCAVRPAQEKFLERIRCSKTQIEAARLLWTRWSSLQSAPAKPSQWAPILRDRHFPSLREALGLQALAEPTPPPLEALDQLHASLPKAPPSLGVEFQQAGVPKGPKLGEAIREADRRIIDEGAIPGPDLVAAVAEFILGSP
ncbi:MAG: CCA tRNA nucleotidyltransferase [Fibrobacterota bacterium]|nr:MAG: CCA tRNA nucleotidyltransferase [Fibrobacterota bacterium]